MSEKWRWIKGTCQGRRGEAGNVTDGILAKPCHQAW